VDKDNDGYCNWGISAEKPSTCPSFCKSQKDCDDSNPLKGPFDENLNCLAYIYSISGTVTYNGTGLSGVTMTLSGSSTATKTTDSSGIYSFTGLSNGSYTVTPSLSEYTFTPANRSVTISGVNQTANFTASSLGCAEWSDVIDKYNDYVSDYAGWNEVIDCYQQYASSE
jgi:hypothetical protein